RGLCAGHGPAAPETELVAAVAKTRRHMHHVRHDLNPPDFRIDPAMLNPWTDPSHSEEDGIRFALRSGALIGTASDVAEQIAELRDAAARHILCQMSFNLLGHERIKASVRRLRERIIPAFARKGPAG